MAAKHRAGLGAVLVASGCSEAALSEVTFVNEMDDALLLLRCVVNLLLVSLLNRRFELLNVLLSALCLSLMSRTVAASSLAEP